MGKYLIAFFCITGLAFSLGVRPSFDLGFGWTSVKMSDDYGDQTDDYTAIRIATIVPYSRIVGLYVEIAAINFFEGGKEMYIGGGGMSGLVFGGLGTKLGVVEMIPSKTVTPYFKQFIMIDRLSDESDFTMTFTSFGFGAGLEFLSTSYVSPVIEAGLSIGSAGTSSSYGSSSTSIFSYGFGAGLRFSWKK